ncbi:hypothetical protein DICSQDRAFT_126976 [Dichomitus squalens LYAD-421 SS1]|uniref:Uncharacterized protein n=2 Tax=Dichomitus squalens TaxID=114155 RepID=A0A4Q9PFL3_9APHY|nr:uncharacterized protein DICSQDRAFT_126976 [Dichomitus squalens LYAD-421 SS1]EJF61545.1 hypothetical protein DICSQDRAFT_126976 [Dichomitus squalens LYAD-421 SS1]TBU53005.1 hypothetical protein BD310DRAFT_909748 [Dichomitus squalens]
MHIWQVLLPCLAKAPLKLDATTFISWYYGITSHDNVVRLNMIPWSCPLLLAKGMAPTEWSWERRLMNQQTERASQYSMPWSLPAALTVDYFRFKVRTWLAYSPKYVLECSSTHSDAAARVLGCSLLRLVILHIEDELLSSNRVRFGHWAIALPDSQIYCGATIIGIKLYSNSVLAALNSRQSLSAQYQHAYIDTTAFGASFMPDVSSDMELSATSRARQPSSRIGKTTPKGSRDNAIQIKVLRTQEFVHDPRENLE